MLTVSDVVARLAELTHREGAAIWDPVGLQLGDPSAAVVRVAVCHEVTEDVIRKLSHDAPDLLVTYHPLLFSPTNRVIGGRSAEARAFKLIQLGVSLLVTHTDFDAVGGGTADALSSVLRLRDVKGFGASEEEGLGDICRHGEFAGTLAVLDAMVCDAFGSSGIRISGDPHRDLERVAVVPGSGSAFIEEAAQHADALVTGDVPHHRSVRALDLGLAVVDPGHTATERPGMKNLVGMVRRVEGVEVLDLTDLDPRTWE